MKQGENFKIFSFVRAGFVWGAICLDEYVWDQALIGGTL